MCDVMIVLISKPIHKRMSRRLKQSSCTSTVLPEAALYPLVFFQFNFAGIQHCQITMSSIDSQEYDVVVDDQMERYQILGQRGSRAQSDKAY